MLICRDLLEFDVKEIEQIAIVSGENEGSPWWFVMLLYFSCLCFKSK
jgi:hypothetical protein